MSLANDRWVAACAPNQVRYPFDIAAKLMRDSKCCTHEEVCTLVNETRKLYDLCKDQDEKIRRLERELRVSEETVRLLQVDNT